MTIGTLRTQGTEIWFLDTVTDSNSTVRKLYCPTAINGLGGGTRDQLDDTCLDNRTTKTFKAGLSNPSSMSIPFNFIPSGEFNQQSLWALKADGGNVKWIVGFEDGTAAPTIDDDLEWVPPTSPNRTTMEFVGFVNELTIDAGTNDIVKGTLTIQVSGDTIPHWNGPVQTA